MTDSDMCALERSVRAKKYVLHQPHQPRRNTQVCVLSKMRCQAKVRDSLTQEGGQVLTLDLGSCLLSCVYRRLIPTACQRDLLTCFDSARTYGAQELSGCGRPPHQASLYQGLLPGSAIRVEKKQILLLWPTGQLACDLGHAAASAAARVDERLKNRPFKKGKPGAAAQGSAKPEG